jgi:hypothetical protein
MKQQTAVEWLIQTIFDKSGVKVTSKNNPELFAIFDQAKAMEKEQIETAYWDGWQNIPSMKPEQYYIDTYQTF